MRGTEIPVDWYVTSFAENFQALLWGEGGEEKATLALEMLAPEERCRILDLACATGKRTLELCRRGFDVVGVEVRGELLEIAGAEAQQQDLWPYFVEQDPRYIGFKREFDLVLSLGAGAFGHFDSDEEDRRALAAVARALRPDGQLLMQLPNVLQVELGLPERTWLEIGHSLEVVEQAWNEDTRRLEGTRTSLVEWDSYEHVEPEPFARRLYTVEEVAQMLGSVDMRLTDVYDDDGNRCVPSTAQREIYIEARA